MTFTVAENIELIHDVARRWPGDYLPDETYDPYVHDRDENEPPDEDDDGGEWVVPDVSGETPDDARTIIALAARRYWMAHR